MRRELGDLVGAAYTHRHLAMHLLWQGRLDEAEQEVHTARALLREHGSMTESPYLQRSLAEIALARGDLIRAAEYAEQSFAAVMDEDDVPKATHRATLARVRAAQGRAEEAETMFRESLEIMDQRWQEYRFDTALVLLKYGESLLALGQPERARTVLQQARSLFAEMGAANFVREVDARLQTASTP